MRRSCRVFLADCHRGDKGCHQFSPQGSQPWAVQLEARAKWDAWSEVKGTSAEEAQRQVRAEARGICIGVTSVASSWCAKL